MKIHRFIISTQKIDEKVQILDKSLVHQCFVVLKLRTGESIAVVGENAEEAIYQIEEIDGTHMALVKTQTVPRRTEARRSVTLCQAITKRDTFEWVTQKATELGVAGIVPLITARTMKTDVRQDRLVAIAREAAEQSGRQTLPAIHEPMDVQKVITSQHQHCVVFDMEGTSCTEYEWPAECTILVGPEGGWSDAERVLFKEQELDIVSCASLTLRAETAAIVAVYESAQRGS